MTRARDVSRLITTPPDIYATDSEASSGYLSLSSASSTYLTQANNRLPFKNLIINGAMEVAQRGTSVSSITTDGYKTADRWRLYTGGSSYGTWTQSVENDAPTGSEFKKSLKMLVTTSGNGSTNGEFIFAQLIESANLKPIRQGTSGALPVTISFWVKSNVTGTYVIEIFNSSNSARISTQYTINSSATWEKKTITFPADTTGGAATLNDNSAGWAVQWALVMGTNLTSGTLNQNWTVNPTTANRFVGQTNLAASTNNYWQITGVQLEVGDTATPFEFKSYAQDLLECQRYFWRGYVAGGGAWGGSGGTVPLVGWPYPVKMRTAPAWAWISGGIAGNGNVGYNVTGIVTSSIQADSALLGFSISGSTGSNAQGCYVYDSLNSFSAEL
jgi:hypothetical protein